VTVASNPLIQNYLDRLERALRGATEDRRREILQEINDHIHESLAEQNSISDSEILSVLERLGSPEEIAAEAREPLAKSTSRPRIGALEVIAIVLLLLGGFFLPILGWVVGVVLLWVSNVWTLRDKIIGTLFVPGGLLLPVYLVFFSFSESCATTFSNGRTISSTCSEPGALQNVLGAMLLVVVVVAPIVTSVYLIRRARSVLSQRAEAQ
jgi:uncharacterized membrane protein